LARELTDKPNNVMTRLVNAWLPPFAWAVLLFGCSSFSMKSVGWLVHYVPGRDKTVHFMMYAVLGGLLSRAMLVTSLHYSRLFLVFLAGTIGSMYGATDEIHQLMVKGRTAEWLDLLADTLGSMSGAFAWGFLLFHRRKDAAGGSGSTEKGSADRSPTRAAKED